MKAELFGTIKSFCADFHGNQEAKHIQIRIIELELYASVIC